MFAEDRGFAVRSECAVVPLLPHAARHSTAKRNASRVTGRIVERACPNSVPVMFEHLGELAAELDRLEAGLADIQAAGDRNASQAAGRRRAELKPIVDAWREWDATSQDLADARELLDGAADDEMREYVRTEIAEKEA